MARLDPHSHADTSQPQVDFLDWQADVDFNTRGLDCVARLIVRSAPLQASLLDLDTRYLDIATVTDADGKDLTWSLAPPEPILGSRLRVELPAGTQSIDIRYRTLPDADAVQWLEEPEPFLYTQCQPIHARSVVPLQDTPRTRLRFQAELRIPKHLKALMAAEALGRESSDEFAIERFRMPQPIAPYLFALAVGNLASRDVGPRSRVWAHPELVDSAAWEFADTEHLLSTGEALFGPYDWDRYDLLVLPPFFPYGGMENPRLTFLTPALLAGDRSMLPVVAHELAHSWTGNLISNANAEHFWLNEGLTTYAERRIVEAVWGQDRAALEWTLSRRELDDAISHFERQDTPELTCLRTQLAGLDPDTTYSLVPYAKGALFLRALEEAVGRPVFDTFLRAYIQQFRFGVLTTEEFLEFAERELPPGSLDRVDVRAWVFAPGVPADAPVFRSASVGAIAALGDRLPSDEQGHTWSPVEWELYLESLPRPAAQENLAELDGRFGLTQSRNYAVLVKWLEVAARANHRPAFGRIEEVLGSIGRVHYLRQLYRALAERPENRPLAHELFQRFGPRYHPIARRVIADELLTSGSPP